MNKLLSIAGAIAILAIASYAGFQLQQYFQGTSATEEQNSTVNLDDKSIIGMPRPDFSLPDLGGDVRHISGWDGKVLVINFWATWCPPCREEIPEFIHLQNQYAEQGLQFIGIALQVAEEVRPFYDEIGMNYPSLVGEQSVISIAKSYGNTLGALPYTVIIDRSGIVQFTRRGPVSIKEAREIIDSLL